MLDATRIVNIMHSFYIDTRGVCMAIESSFPRHVFDLPNAQIGFWKHAVLDMCV